MRYCLAYLSCVVFFCFGSFCSEAQKAAVVSPDKRIKVSISGSSDGGIRYHVSFMGKTLVDWSPLGLDVDGLTGTPKRWAKKKEKTILDDYRLLVGKSSHVMDTSRELSLELRAGSEKELSVNLVFRVFNEGVAFSYEVPEQSGRREYIINRERTAFRLAGNPYVQSLLFRNTLNSHEGFYQKRWLNRMPSDSLMDMPALFVFPDSIYVAITEARLRNYAGMYLKRNGDLLETFLSPLPDGSGNLVRAELPHRSPWRILLIGDHPADLLESDMITSLNDDPVSEEDFSWLRPGKTSFHWWNGDVLPDTSFEAGANFLFNKYYIDFCARNGIQYHSVIGFAGQPWYVNDGGANYQPGPGTDITRTIPNIDIKAICEYARSKNVNIHVWVHWKALYPKLDTAFLLFEQWGIKGMMVDFMDRDDQEMVNIQEEILKKAAKHHLYIQFHGAFKPTGLHRTYPNEFTREGTHNYEQNKWSAGPVSAGHDLDICFTRLLAGAADYHLGGFRAVPEAQWKPQYSRPLMGGTRAHMMAMYVVLESYLASLCDDPEAYEGQDGFDFLLKVPTTWDETRVPVAELNNHLVMARRKGDEWWIGSINNEEEKTIRFPLSFLGEGKFEATIQSDAENAEQFPNTLHAKTIEVSSASILTLKMAASGGAVVHLKPID